MTHDDGQPPRSSAGVESKIAWLAACVISVTGLSIAAAHAPSRVRLIGLFSIAFGLVVGWIVVRLASQLEVKCARRVTVFTAVLLSFCGLIGSTWQTSRLDEALSAQSAKDALASRLMREFERRQSQSANDNSNPSKVAEFQKYLSRRLQKLGNWTSPWPECFWVTELVAAAIAAGWLSYQSMSPDVQVFPEGSEA